MDLLDARLEQLVNQPLDNVLDQSEYLSILSHADAEQVKLTAESLLTDVGSIDVLMNRTGLVMLPYTDTAQGTPFHLGEVLVAEAHIQLADGTEGYGMCLGRDLVQALAIAVLDAALTAGIRVSDIQNFVEEQARVLAADDDHLLRSVESTRVEMETF